MINRESLIFIYNSIYLLKLRCVVCNKYITEEHPSGIFIGGHTMHPECEKQNRAKSQSDVKDITEITVETKNTEPMQNSVDCPVQLVDNKIDKEYQILKNYNEVHSQIIKEMSEIRLQISETRKDIQSVIEPKFLNISIHTKDLIEHAIEIWRIQQRLVKIILLLPETQQELINNSIEKLVRYLSKNDIEIVDYTNQKFNDGRNLDVLAVEKRSDISESIIKETKEPTIIYKNQVVHKSKVIIFEKITS